MNPPQNLVTKTKTRISRSKKRRMQNMLFIKGDNNKDSYKIHIPFFLRVKDINWNRIEYDDRTAEILKKEEEDLRDFSETEQSMSSIFNVSDDDLTKKIKCDIDTSTLVEYSVDSSTHDDSWEKNLKQVSSSYFLPDPVQRLEEQSLAPRLQRRIHGIPLQITTAKGDKSQEVVVTIESSYLVCRDRKMSVQFAIKVNTVEKESENGFIVSGTRIKENTPAKVHFQLLKDTSYVELLKDVQDVQDKNNCDKMIQLLTNF